MQLHSMCLSCIYKLVFFRRWLEVLGLVVIILSCLTVLFILLEDHSVVTRAVESVVSHYMTLFR